VNAVNSDSLLNWGEAHHTESDVDVGDDGQGVDAVGRAAGPGAEVPGATTQNVIEFHFCSGGWHTTRNPTWLLALTGWRRLRAAERQFLGPKYREPPRSK
jgi:hypothetical protein